jgi:predicted dehydrogenase
VYADLKQVLDDPAVDAVELLTPTWLHADQIVAALAAGKHVSCQKPLATTVAEADRIATAVARARTTFRVTENFLYYPPILKAKELLDAGAIGEPSLVRIHTTRTEHITGRAIDLEPDAMVWRRDRGRNPGGPLYDDGVHKYATAALWIGEIGDISAIVTRGEDILAETPAAAMWRFKGRDCLGIIDYTSAPEMTIRSRYYGADEFFEIHGTRGIIWVTRCTGEMLDLPAVVLIRGAETVSHQVPTDWRLGFDGAAVDFVDSLLAGRQPAQDVRAATHILSVPLAIYEAARTGRPVAPEPLA